MSIFEVQHQPIAQAVTQQALASGRLAHGLLMVGPGGVGKEMFANRLAALLLCDDPIDVADGAVRAGVEGANLPDGLAPPPGTPWRDACGQCPSCIQAAAGQHPDIHLVQRELYKTISDLKSRQGLELYIQVIIQYIIDPASRKSYRGRGKVFIVRDAHLMNDEAQNALLKTLEEPPPGTTLMLLTDQVHRLLETIRSRCQLLRFTPLPTEFVREEMTDVAVDGRSVGAREAAYLAARSGGRLGEARRMAAADLFGTHQELADRLTKLRPQNAMALADWLEDTINALAKERSQRDEITESQAKKDVAGDLLTTASLVLSEAMRCSVGAEGEGEGMLPEAAGALASGADPADRCERLARAVRDLSRADYLIAERFINVRLTLDEVAIAVADHLAG